MKDSITVDELAAMLRGGVSRVRRDLDLLTRLDSAIGDGDHGLAMQRAADAIEAALAGGAGSLGDLLSRVGWEVMSIDGGSTGPLLGSLFLGMSDGAGPAASLDRDQLRALFEAGLNGLRGATGAKVGDKTLMDALIPAVDAIAACPAGADIPACLAAAAEAAERGAEATRPLRARFGRARNLGDRAIGHLDPGAVTVSLLFQGFAEALAPLPPPRDPESEENPSHGR